MVLVYITIILAYFFGIPALMQIVISAIGQTYGFVGLNYWICVGIWFIFTLLFSQPRTKER